MSDALTAEIHEVLAGIQDPEMPISIVDLGLVDDVRVDEGAVTVRILPTFVGCPALDMLRQEITQKAASVRGVRRVHVQFVHDPPWSPDRISDAGRAQLREVGVSVPVRRDGCGSIASPAVPVALGLGASVACPYCGAETTDLQNIFGPTRCRMIYYCNACKNQFEHMKMV